jgi:hypothetical protein
MPLNKIKLKAEIKAAFVKAASETENPDAVVDALSETISNAIDEFVKGLQITYVPANPQNPPPTPFVAGIYPVTGTFSYTLS